MEIEWYRSSFGNEYDYELLIDTFPASGVEICVFLKKGFSGPRLNDVTDGYYEDRHLQKDSPADNIYSKYNKIDFIEYVFTKMMEEIEDCKWHY